MTEEMMVKPQKVNLSNVVSLVDMSKPLEGDADRPNDNVPSLDDTTSVTFRQIGEWLNEKPNTVSARYYPRVVQAHEGLESPALQVNGKPTGYAAKAIALYLQTGKDYAAYRGILEQRYSKSSQAQAQAVEVAIAPYQPEEIELQMHDSLGRFEDRKLRAIAKAAVTIQQYKTEMTEMRKAEEREVYEQAFTEEVERLEAEARLKKIAARAKLKARQLFDLDPEDSGD